MVLAFIPDCTFLVCGKYHKIDGLKITTGQLPSYILEKFQKTLSVFFNQSSSNMHFTYILDKTNNGLLVYQREGDKLHFNLAFNPLFQFREIRDHIIKEMQNRVDSIKISEGDSLLILLQKIEDDFLNQGSNDYLEFFPLLINPLLDEQEKNGLKDFTQFGFSSCDLSLIFPLISDFDDGSFIDNLLDNQDIFAFATNEEKWKFIYNIAILCLKTNSLTPFHNIIEQLIQAPFKKISSYSKILYAQTLYMDNPKEAKKIIVQIDENIFHHFSNKAKIRFYRLKASILEMNQDYKNSLELYMKVVSLPNTQNEITEDLALAYAGIGNINSKIGQYAKAISAFSFASSIFDFLSLKKHQDSMLRNIITLNMIKARNYLSAGIMSLNETKYSDGFTYLKKALTGFSILLLESPVDLIMTKASEITELLASLIIRFDLNKNLEPLDEKMISDFKQLYNISCKIIEEQEKNSFITSTLKKLAIPEEVLIYQIFVLYVDGRVLYIHKTKNYLDLGGKDILFAGAFSAIQMILDETFKKRENFSIDLGDKKILFLKGGYINLLFVTNKVDDLLIEKADITLEQIERTFRTQLVSWDGNLETFNGLDYLISSLFD